MFGLVVNRQDNKVAIETRRMDIATLLGRSVVSVVRHQVARCVSDAPRNEEWDEDARVVEKMRAISAHYSGIRITPASTGGEGGRGTMSILSRFFPGSSKGRKTGEPVVAGADKCNSAVEG